MSLRSYQLLESTIISLGSPGETVSFQGKKYRVVTSGKPRPPHRGGECKTDVFILLHEENGNDTVELKISAKLPSADFIENKIGVQRAQCLLGEDYQRSLETIASTVSLLLDKVHEKSPPIDRKRGKIRLGYRLDIINKSSGLQSFPAQPFISPDTIQKIFSGENLPDKKKNCYVNGEIIPNSGVANYIIIASPENLCSLQDVCDRIVSIEEFTQESIDAHFAFKAVNYIPGKKPENRPLIVRYDYVDNGEGFDYSVSTDKPLEVLSMEVARSIPASLISSVCNS